jgi:hypothetical protein
VGPAKTLSASRKSRPRCSMVRRRLAGSKRITSQEAVDEGSQRHGTAAGNPAAPAWDPTPAPHLKVGIGAGEELNPVAVLGMGGLLRALNWLRPGLGAQEGSKEGGGFRVFA